MKQRSNSFPPFLSSLPFACVCKTHISFRNNFSYKCSAFLNCFPSVNLMNWRILTAIPDTISMKSLLVWFKDITHFYFGKTNTPTKQTFKNSRQAVCTCVLTAWFELLNVVIQWFTEKISDNDIHYARQYINHNKTFANIYEVELTKLKNKIWLYLFSLIDNKHTLAAGWCW